MRREEKRHPVTQKRKKNPEERSINGVARLLNGIDILFKTTMPLEISPHKQLLISSRRRMKDILLNRFLKKKVVKELLTLWRKPKISFESDV